ncbi:hypothetical protein HYALB_00013254 [Hymenoscyphus albidus]|uniref:Rhodopsin domain-containing protein n=1 Tax=Hymenoscyphus albidus TaxID=595503 RepID=A0A9N9LXX0_9HELO|nr:hypothetical protein HYALB_00013254 [Hymenoscyphus albidus]
MISLTNNRGPILNVAMWVMLVPTAMMVMVKIYTKFHTVKTIKADDVFINMAFLTAIAQSIAITQEVKFGLGQKRNVVDSGNLNKLLIAQYMSNVFYAISIYTAKISTAFFFKTLCKDNTSRKVVKSTIWALAIWLLVSVVTLLAQCHLPRPWDSFGKTCINLKAFWTVSLAVDVTTQVILAFLPTYLLSGLQISNKSNKWLVIAVFIPNLFVMPLAVFRLLFLFHAMNSEDFTWESFHFGIFTSFHPFVAIMVTSLPFIKPVLDSLILQPYLIAVEEPQSIIPGYSKGVSWAQRMLNSGSARSQKVLKGSNSTGGRNDSSLHWPYTQRQEEDSIDPANQQQFKLGDYRVKVEGDRNSTGDPEANRIETAGRMVIRQTKTATIETK